MSNRKKKIRKGVNIILVLQVNLSLKAIVSKCVKGHSNSPINVGNMPYLVYFETQTTITTY